MESMTYIEVLKVFYDYIDISSLKINHIILSIKNAAVLFISNLVLVLSNLCNSFWLNLL